MLWPNPPGQYRVVMCSHEKQEWPLIAGLGFNQRFGRLFLKYCKAITFFLMLGYGTRAWVGRSWQHSRGQLERAAVTVFMNTGVFPESNL